MAYARRTHRETGHARRRKFLAAYIPPAGSGSRWASSGRISRNGCCAISRPGRCIWSIPWDRLHGAYFRFKTSYTLDGDLPVAVTYAKAEALARRYPDIVKVHKAYSTEFFPTLPDASLDWVYLDAAHDYDRVMADLTCIWPKLKPDGILFGDDYFDDPKVKHHGVYRAVNAFAAQEQARLIVEKHYQYILLRPEARLAPDLPRTQATRAGVWPEGS